MIRKETMSKDSADLLMNDLGFDGSSSNTESSIFKMSNLMGLLREHLVILLCSLIGFLYLLRLVCKIGGRSHMGSIEEINKTYKDLEERNESLKRKIERSKTNREYLTLARNLIITGCCFVAIWCYRTPSNFVYLFREIPHFALTIPLGTFFLITYLSRFQTSRIE